MPAFQCAFPDSFATTATTIVASFIPSSPLHFLTVSAIPPCLCGTFPKFGDLLSHRGYDAIGTYRHILPGQTNKWILYYGQAKTPKCVVKSNRHRYHILASVLAHMRDVMQIQPDILREYEHEIHHVTPHLPVSSMVLGCEENLYFERWNSRTHPAI